MLGRSQLLHGRLGLPFKPGRLDPYFIVSFVEGVLLFLPIFEDVFHALVDFLRVGFENEWFLLGFRFRINWLGCKSPFYFALLFSRSSAISSVYQTPQPRVLHPESLLRKRSIAYR